MKTSNSKPKVNQQIYAEAAEWLVELRAGDVDPPARERLDAWFRESPHHIRAFLELSSIWEDGGDTELDRSHTMDELIARARAAANVVPLGWDTAKAASRRSDLPAMSPSTSNSRRTVVRRLSWRSAIGASFVCTCAIGALGYWLYGRVAPAYGTGIGEERLVELTDGSTVQLNSRTEVRIHFSAHERAVSLIRGEALFQVAKDPTRPFVVRSDSTRVRALGTRFDIYRRTSGTIVTVVEGKVAVLPVLREQTGAPKPETDADSTSMADTAGAVILTAGEQLIVAQSSTTKPARADVAAATAWTKHQLVFDFTPLIAVASEFNRYNARQLVIADPGLKEFHVTGVFSSTDPASLIRFLRIQHGIRIEETDKEIRISAQ